MKGGAQTLGGDEVGAAGGVLEEQVAGVRGIVARGFLEQAGGGVGVGGLVTGREPAGAVEGAVAVEVQDVHRRQVGAAQPVGERGECRRAEEFAGHAPGGLGGDRVHDRAGVGARVEEAGVRGAADDEEEVQPRLGLGRDRGAPRGGPGDPAADGEALVEEIGPVGGVGVVEQFPGEREHGRVQGADGEQPRGGVRGRGFGVLEAVDQPPGGVGGEDGAKECLAECGQAPADAPRISVVRVAEGAGGVGLDVPADLLVVLGGEGVREGQGTRVLAVEADGHMLGVGEQELELGGHPGSPWRGARRGRRAIGG